MAITTLERETGNKRAKEFISRAVKCGSFSFDIEHNARYGPHTKEFRIHGVGLSTDGLTFYETANDRYCYILNILFPTDVEAIAYNAKYDLKCLKIAGAIDDYPKNVVDPMVAVNLLDDNRHYNQLSLERVVEDYYGEDRESFKEASIEGLNSARFYAYACNDARDEFRLWRDLRQKLFDEGLDKLFFKILMPVEKVFADIEINGVGWDRFKALDLLRGYQLLRDRLSKEIYSKIGHLNLKSGDQLAKRLFGDLGYSAHGIGMTTSGKRYSVDSKAMEKLSRKYPVCEKITLYRTAEKMINTYVEPLTRQALDNPSGRIHPTFWIVSTTGRTRSSHPNFQNIPAFFDKKKYKPYFGHLNIRKNVVPEKGRKLIVADLSQIELRVVAHITQDPIFLNSFRDWQCTLCRTEGTSKNELLVKCPNCGALENPNVIESGKKKEAGFWHGLDLHQITTDSIPALGGDRKAGKAANFALVYCATASRMNMEYPELSIQRWGEVIEDYFDTYRQIKIWHLRMQRRLTDVGVCTDIFGRKRRIPKSIVARSFKHALNMFVNFSPQSSACAMMELSLVKIRDHFVETGDWQRTIFPTNMVHDEIVFEVDEDKVQSIAPVIRHYLETPVKLHVPVRADIKICDNWGQAK